MAHDTPPVYVPNTRQLQKTLSLRKIEKLRLCVEITEKDDGEISREDGAEKNYEEVYDGLSLEEEHDDNENNFSSILDGSNQKDVGEDEENEEDDEFESRFDMFDDSDDASSEDDNFSSYGESPAQDEDSPTPPPKSRSKNLWMGGCKEDPEVLRLEMSSLNLAVGQRYESKAELERRLKLLSVKDEFDFDVEVSNPDLLIVKYWVAGCIWRVCASTQGDSPAFYVRIYESLHTCSVTERSNRSRQATPDILGQLYKDYLGDVGPAIRPTSVGIALNKQFGLKTLKFGREIDERTPESGFENLPSYLYMIRSANPDTVTRLQINEFGRFMYVFLAFGESINGLPFMRKVVVVDDDKDLAIISDRHKSIGKAIRNVYPLASRGICTYHLYKNILGRYKGKDVFRLVKKAARCFRMPDFTAIYEEIEAINPELHGYLERADPRLWARVHFPGERWFAERRDATASQPTTLTRCVEKLLQGRVTTARLLTVQRIDANHTEVTYGESLHVVNLEGRKCTCRRFERERISCSHAIAAAESRNVSRISLCSPYYTNAYLVSAYAQSIMLGYSAQPVPDNVVNLPCFPPSIRRQPGRPKKNRMKSALEVALEKKCPRKEHTCSRCRQSGHNVKTCPI
ncbi:uncharacterized protein LOC108851125 [Raphanus sativus]|uniref:Uncharacterized protein LOC108851125 n=1 Tax=Raphanus sativus TaxID=3726 RepID=A0A9W3DL20_RAPSA|nr:uncharacterized protein LOC108851125 [Raphanus sativus]